MAAIWLQIPLAIIVFYASIDRTDCSLPNLIAGGRNVATTLVRKTQSYTTVQYYTGYDNYRTCCGRVLGYCYRHCTRYRTVLRSQRVTRYRTIYETQYICGAGWRQEPGSNECLKPICNSPACVHGQCVRPNTCQCNNGYTSPSTGCNIDNDECTTLQSPCTCDDIINNPSCTATCQNLIGSFRCLCSAGYRTVGSTRCVDTNECMHNHGGCSQLCTNTPGSRICSCRLGFVLHSNGTTCNDEDECQVNNGGCQHQCINQHGSYECRCRNGHFLDPNGKTCSDIDECSLHVHDCQHTCNNYKGGFYCTCRNGFKLNNDNKTCSDLDECSVFKTGPSETNVTLAGCTQLCHNNFGSFSCSCRTGFKLMQDGKTCNDIDECSGNHGCEHSCLNTVGSYICRCPNGYRLDGDKRSCVGLPCIRLPPVINGNGTCFTGKTNETCQLGCFVGFELRGSSLRRCLPNHKWSGSITTCNRKYCDPLVPPMNGGITLPCIPYYYGSCSIKCSSGYYATGNPKRTCRATADNRMFWNNANTTCAKIEICTSDPCKHGGICQEISKTEYKCDCRNTGYEGETCNRGVIKIPEFPMLQMNKRYSFIITAKPERQLGLEITTNSNGVIFTPSRFNFTADSNTVTFTVRSNQQGLHLVRYSLSGTNANIFAKPQTRLIYVRDDGYNNFTAINNIIDDKGTFIQGCYVTDKLKIKDTQNKSIVFHSSAPWMNASEYDWTDGVVVMDIQGVVMPTSIIGSNVSARSIENKDFGSFTQKYSNDNFDSAKTLGTDNEANSQRCSSKIPSSSDLTDVIELNAFSKTMTDSVNSRTPYWINLAANLTTNSFTATDFIANVYNDTKLRHHYPECSRLLGNDANSLIWHAYVTMQRLSLHMAEEELVLDSGKQTCIFGSVNERDTLIGFLQSELYCNVFKTSTGWSNKVNSVRFTENGVYSSLESAGAFSDQLSLITGSSNIIVKITGSIQFNLSNNSNVFSEGISSIVQTKGVGLISVELKCISAFNLSLRGKGFLRIEMLGSKNDVCLNNYIIDISSTKKSAVGPKLGKVVKVDAFSKIIVSLYMQQTGGKILDGQQCRKFQSIQHQVMFLDMILSNILVQYFSNQNTSSVVKDVKSARRLSNQLVTLCSRNAGPSMLPLHIELKKTINRIERKFQILSIPMRGKALFEQLAYSFQTSMDTTHNALKLQFQREIISKKVRSYTVSTSATMCLDVLCFPRANVNVIHGLTNLQLKQCYGINKVVGHESLVIGMTTTERTLAGVLKIPSNTRILYFTSETGPGTGLFNASLSIYGSEKQVEVMVYNNTLKFAANVTLPDTSIAEMQFFAGLSKLKTDGDVLMKVKGSLGINSYLISQMNIFLQNKLARMANQTKRRIDALSKAVNMTSKQQIEAVRNLREVKQDYVTILHEEASLKRRLNGTRNLHKFYMSILKTELSKHASVVANLSREFEACAPRICVNKCVKGNMSYVCYDTRHKNISLEKCTLEKRSYTRVGFRELVSTQSYTTTDPKPDCRADCSSGLLGRKRRALFRRFVKAVESTISRGAKGVATFVRGTSRKMGAFVGDVFTSIAGTIIQSLFGSCDKTCNIIWVPRIVHYTNYDTVKDIKTVQHEQWACRSKSKKIESGFKPARLCSRPSNCSEYKTDVDCVTENNECLSYRKQLRRRINQKLELAPAYDSYVTYSLELESLETKVRLVEVDRKNAYQDYLAARSLSLKANYSVNIAKESLASASSVLALELRAVKGVETYGSRSYSVTNGQWAFHASRGSVIPMTIALDMDILGGDMKTSLTTSIIHLKNTNESVLDATNDVIKTLFGKSARKRRSILNADDVTETITVGDLDLNVTKSKCNTMEENLFYLLEVLSGFSAGVSLHENMTKEMENAVQSKRNFMENINERIESSNLCSKNSTIDYFNQSIKAENCSTEWLIGLYENMTTSGKSNDSLSWPSTRTRVITDLEIYTKSLNFTSCAGLRDCVHASIDIVSELVEFEQSYLAKLCRQAIPVWRMSYERMLNNDSLSHNETKMLTQAILKSFEVSRPGDVYCDTPPIIITNLPSEVIVTQGQSIVLNFSLVIEPHKTTFVWSKDGEPMSTSAKQRFELKNINSSDAGYYTCEVANKFGKIATETVHVVYQEKPSIITHPNDVKTTLKSPSSSIILVCNASAIPPPTLSWFYAPFGNTSQLTLLPFNGYVLNLNATSSNQSGFYYCKASNQQGFVYSRPARVHVLQSKIAEMAVTLSFDIHSQAGQNETAIPVPLVLSQMDQENLTASLAGLMNTSMTRLSNLHYTRISIHNAMLSFDLRTQNLDHLLPATSDWSSISEDIVLARKGLFFLSYWLYYGFSNVTDQLRVGDANFTVKPDTMDVDLLPGKCPTGYSLSSNGFICEICPAGRRYYHGAGCSLCPKNSYQTKQGQQNCVKCPKKFVTRSSGSVHYGDCFKPELTTTTVATSTASSSSGSKLSSAKPKTTSKSVTKPKVTKKATSQALKATTKDSEFKKPETARQEGKKIQVWVLTGACFGGIALLVIVIGLVYRRYSIGKRQAKARIASQNTKTHADPGADNSVSLKSYRNPGYDAATSNEEETLPPQPVLPSSFDNPIYETSSKDATQNSAF
eukprot:gene3951-4496_t